MFKKWTQGLIAWALKEMSQRFIYDMTKSGLAYYYKSTIDGIQEAKGRAWDTYLKDDISAVEVVGIFVGINKAVARISKLKMIIVVILHQFTLI